MGGRGRCLSVLDEFTRECLGIAATAASMVRLVTIPADSGRGPGRHVGHDWDAGVDRDTILANAGAAAGFRAEVKIVSRRMALHARELEIVWSDGASWKLRLDEGFGFLEPRAAARYDFCADAASQGRTLADLSLSIGARSPSLAYVFEVAPGS